MCRRGFVRAAHHGIAEQDETLPRLPAGFLSMVRHFIFSIQASTFWVEIKKTSLWI
jgi:hypothetical protein